MRQARRYEAAVHLINLQRDLRISGNLNENQREFGRFDSTAPLPGVPWHPLEGV